MKPTLISRGKLKHVMALLAGLALGAGAIAAIAEPSKAGYAPDPPGRASAKQWVFDVRVQRGKPALEKARSATVAKPYETARVMGRYALELYVGPELLDRIRFNVPLSGDGPTEEADRPRKNPFARPRFDDVTTRLRIQMADNPRAAYLALVDRATGNVERFEWPPAPDGSLVPILPAKAGASAAPSAAASTPAGPIPPKDGGVDGSVDASIDIDSGGIPDASLRPAGRTR